MNLIRIFNGINTYDSTKLYNSIWQPAFDITEDDKSYHISFDLPGINRKEIDVSISNDILTVSGFRESSMLNIMMIITDLIKLVMGNLKNHFICLIILIKIK